MSVLTILELWQYIELVLSALTMFEYAMMSKWTNPRYEKCESLGMFYIVCSYSYVSTRLTILELCQYIELVLSALTMFEYAMMSKWTNPRYEKCEKFFQILILCSYPPLKCTLI